jgi:hypothetical protein
VVRVAWRPGETIVHREVWRGAPWCACPVVVVEDMPGQLVTYLPEEAPFAFPASADGRPHPWGSKRSWHGHGVLMLRRPQEAYAVWHFWDGPDRRFAGWYLNLEEPIRRTTTGYDTQDLELDIWIPVGEPWRFKDDEVLDERVRDGRYTPEQVAATRALGREIGAILDRGERWWDERWASFEPEPAWRGLGFPPGWEEAPVTPAPPPAAYRTLPV